MAAMTRCLARCVLVSVLALCVRVQAQTADVDERPPDDATPAAEQEWYGWQTLTIDALALGMIITQAAIEDGPVVLSLVGLGTYVLGAPIIHFVHENEWAAPSLGLRLGSLALMVGGAVVALSGDCFIIFGERPSSCDRREAIGVALMIAGLVMVPVAITLDVVKARGDGSRERAVAQLRGWGNPSRGSAGLSLVIAR
jgi:uncharacterized membrane protein YdcZ (DUF606 family)